MKKFYAVTAGDYSDYHIVTITDDKEKAEHIKYLCNRKGGYYGDANIEEYHDIMQDNRICYWVHIYSDKEARAGIQFDAHEDFEINKAIKMRDGSYAVYVMAEDESHAIKIASDLVAQYKAQENGIA